MMSSVATVVSYVAFLAIWAWAGHGFTSADAGRPGIDFATFWTASHVALQGSPLQVYNHLTFANAAHALFGGFADVNALPWAYPPAFLMAVSPLALLPFAVGYLLFVVGTAALYVVTTVRVSGLDKSIGSSQLAAFIVAASPCVFVTAIVGQNSLLTAALAALALGSMTRKPVLAGICIGLLAIKPQMAVVFPFVLIATREWKVFAIAALSALVVTVAGVLFCGTASLHGFFLDAGLLRTTLLEHDGQRFWFASPTPFSALRAAGMPIVAAYIAHACVAAVAIGAACSVCKHSADVRLRSAAVVVAALLVSPYVWHYELVWLGVALACLCAVALSSQWLRGEQAALAAGWLLPIYEHFNRVMMLPQFGPVVLLIVMWMVLRRARLGTRARS
ncbi:DUF2029 domain-containing protein [Trinickia sp. LjRoot230]|uniref:glycosyltransferase family 87 protein n=1 Tax=Trinickia sp. LjRoot230 TaxID=3342288 RepID=UPI003ECF2869